ncbi:MAG: glyceraldehyde-3-phosphate dehydrogenase [Thermodesulfovibrionales bacterium]|nr:glyceraldehyde-3-phosphate dehydrogenase [Thermodesulfovibrionales bacterium]
MEHGISGEGSGSANKAILGINGLGRIGKLALWNHIGRKFFSHIIVNIGRNAGSKLEDIANYIVKDSNYGSLARYLYGYKAKDIIDDVDEKNSTIRIDGVPITILKESRNPAEIRWDEYGVEYVVDATGKFLDPTIPEDVKGGSVRGHFKRNVKKVIVTAPFKIKDKNAPWPEDSVTVVMGINDNEYDPNKHKIISAASCTTTCLSHMLKPLVDYFGSDKILSITMSTIHAMTSSQEILDRLPKDGATDLRKNRSVFNNIILTTTGVSKTLHLIIPELRGVPFIAESIRVPVTTGSLIVLFVTIGNYDELLTKELVNMIYKEASAKDKNGYLLYSEEQNVSTDIVGKIGPAAIIEGNDTYVLNSYISTEQNKKMPVSQLVIHGWYDNELGSFTNVMGDLTVRVVTTSTHPEMAKLAVIN